MSGEMTLAKSFLLPTEHLREASFFNDAVVLVCRHDKDGAFGIVVNKPSPTKAGDLLRALRVKAGGGTAGNVSGTDGGVSGTKGDRSGTVGEVSGTKGDGSGTDGPDSGTAGSDSGTAEGGKTDSEASGIYISPAADAFPVMQGGPVLPEQVFVLHSPERKFEATFQVDDDIAVTFSRDILAAIGEGRAPQKILFAFGHAGWTEGQLESELDRNSWVIVPAAADVVFDLPAADRLPTAMKRVGFDISQLSTISGNA